MPHDAERDHIEPLPRSAAPPATISICYNPITQQQAEIDTLREQNQELQSLLEELSRGHREFKEEITANVASFRRDLQTEIDGLRATGIRLLLDNQELRRLLEEKTREHQQFRAEINTAVDNLFQEQQTNKQAISFLLDKLQETSKVAFHTGNCDAHGKNLPIPLGFDKKHCKFFTGGQGKYVGSGVGDVVPIFQTGDTMVLPYSGNCELSGGAYGVWAARPIISEQEIAAKKIEYRLTP